MGVWWILVTLTLMIVTVPSESEPSVSLPGRPNSLLADRIDRLERDLSKLSDQVSMNEIENLRMGLSHYYYFLLLLLLITDNK